MRIRRLATVAAASAAAMVLGLGAAPAAFAAPSHSSPATAQVRQRPHHHQHGHFALPRVPSVVSCGIDVVGAVLPAGYVIKTVVDHAGNVDKVYGVISDASNGKQVGEILLNLIPGKSCVDLAYDILIWYYTDIAPKLAPLTTPPPGQPNQPGPPPANNGQCIPQPDGQCIPFVTLGGNPPA